MNSQESLLLREPFDEKHISKLPKPTRKQTDLVKSDFGNGVRCKVCGGWHHKDVVHLDYVGHAAVTDRLLKVDPEWYWEPLSVDDKGQPVYEQNGGMWINLSVCGVTRLGYGSADGKKGGNAIKEIIGDAIRNAGMRFGMALDLWSKADLDSSEDEPVDTISMDQAKELRTLIIESGSNEIDFTKFLKRELKANSIEKLTRFGFDFAKNSLAMKIKSNIKRQKAVDDKNKQFHVWFDTQVANINVEQKLTVLSLVYEASKAELPKQTKQYGLNNTEYSEILRKAYMSRKAEITPEIELVCTSCGSVSKGTEGSKCPECKEPTIKHKSEI